MTPTPAAMARLRVGRSPTMRPRRMGSSIQRWLAAATGMVAAEGASRVGRGSGVVATAAGMTRIGQCQRYREYEIRPSHRIGGVARIRDDAASGWPDRTPIPARMTRPAPRLGSSAATPG